MDEVKVIKISKNRFDLLMLLTRNPNLLSIAAEIEYYSDNNEKIIGIILFDFTDKDFNIVLLARDDNQQFRAFDVISDFESLDKARNVLISKIKWFILNDSKTKQQSLSKSGLKLFDIIVESKKIHPYFLKVKESDQFYPSKMVLTEIANYMHDIDGNFVEQFQSLNGFDSRLWEIYLFAALSEEKFELIRKYDRPDFIIKKGDHEIAIEASIISRDKKSHPSHIFIEELPNPQKVKEELKNDIPLKFGSTIFSKLKKEYWKLPQVNNKPLIFAIADFNKAFSMVWSFPALVEYLYGQKQIVQQNADGSFNIVKDSVQDYEKPNGTKIPSGLFFQEGMNVEKISGILFSSTGTISKFTRMGIQAGFSAKNQYVTRMGTRLNFDSNAINALPFVYKVNEECSERWCEGLNLFHNPNAENKIDKELFPNIAHHEFLNEELITYAPDFHPFSSINMNVIEK